MQQTSVFAAVVVLITLIASAPVSADSCTVTAAILQCSVTGPVSTLNTNSYPTSDPFNSITVTYSGNVALSLTSSSTKPIAIKSMVDTDVLQISSLSTSASRIDIWISVSATRGSTSLFTTSSNYTLAPDCSLSINIKQSVADVSTFALFDGDNSPRVTFANYEVIFDRSVSNAGTLVLSNLISRSANVSSIMISGNNHVLTVDTVLTTSYNTVKRLGLKNLRLNNQILHKFPNLKEYSIEGCEYSRTAQFLKPVQYQNISLALKNNNPLDRSLPNGDEAFTGYQTLLSLTIVEPNLDSTCLKAIKPTATPKTVVLELGSYLKTHFDDWILSRPVVWYLTINRLSSLAIFSPAFFNKLDALQQVTLQGAFTLPKDAICTFVGINTQNNRIPPLVILNSSATTSQDWNRCANTYVQAINQKSMKDVRCPNDNTDDDCEQWAEETKECELSSYEEKQCTGVINREGIPFSYKNSALSTFFDKAGWKDPPAGSQKPSKESLNIGAIVGALCALLVAIAVLTLTIFFIRRRRQKNLAPPVPSAPEEKYKPSSYDLSHVSIATSKSSKSSSRPLEKSFFPPMQPNDQIAPPLYTAPSESIATLPAYKDVSGRRGRRDSASTHATHVYETLDP